MLNKGILPVVKLMKVNTGKLIMVRGKITVHTSVSFD